MTALATVSQLESRLGVTLTGLDLARAEAALEDVSERAKSVAQRPEWTAGTVPKSVVVVVLSAARREYVNPDRYQYNMAGQFAATAAGDQFNGDIFMAGELAELEKHRPTAALRTLTFYRDADGVEHPGYGRTVLDDAGNPMPLAKPILLDAYGE